MGGGASKISRSLFQGPFFKMELYDFFYTRKTISIAHCTSLLMQLQIIYYFISLKIMEIGIPK